MAMAGQGFDMSAAYNPSVSVSILALSSPLRSLACAGWPCALPLPSHPRVLERWLGFRWGTMGRGLTASSLHTHTPAATLAFSPRFLPASNPRPLPFLLLYTFLSPLMLMLSRTIRWLTWSWTGPSLMTRLFPPPIMTALRPTNQIHALLFFLRFPYCQAPLLKNR